MSNGEILDDGGEVDPGEAESLFRERVSDAEVPEGDHSPLSPTEQDDFMARYAAQD